MSRGLDRLLWSMCADAVQAVVVQVGAMVSTAESIPQAREMAEKRIVTMRQIGERMVAEANAAEDRLNGVASMSIEEAAEGFGKNFPNVA